MSPRKVREAESPKLRAPTFEANFAELEQALAKLERGDLPLEESIALYERGMLLAGQLEQTLAEAELRVKKLRPEAAEFEEESDGGADV